jgi:conjugative transfer pilus assembly protein TraH
MQLALETVSPVIAEKVEELQSWVQRINAMNINSCETAASLVGGLWPRHEQASKTVCSTLAAGSGVATDYTRARHDCHSSRKGTSSKIRSSDPDNADKLLTEDINIAWKALKDSGFFNLSGADRELAELFMTLSGTIVIHAPNSKDDKPKFEYIAGKATHSDLIATLLDGGTIPYHTCDETNKCLNIGRNSGTHAISQEQAFKAKVEKMIFSLIEKIRNDSPLTDEEKRFLNYKASVPLYKILNVYAAYSGSGAMFELPAYSEAIALQMLFEYLDDVLRQVDTASDSLVIADSDHIKRFRDDIREARRTLAQREQKTHQNYATLMTLVDRAMMVEGILAKNIGSPLVDAFHWSKNM